MAVVRRQLWAALTHPQGTAAPLDPPTPCTSIPPPTRDAGPQAKGLHMGSSQPPRLLCCPAGSPWSSIQRCLSSTGILPLPNEPVPQLPMDKQPLQPGETEAGRHQACPRLLFTTGVPAPVHLHPELLYKVIFHCVQGSATHPWGDTAGPAPW